MIDDIITDVLKAEGWDKYTNDPVDRGGPTKWGITLKAWSDYRRWDVTAADIQDITEAQARDFYEKRYVIGPKFHLLPEMMVPLVVDCGVNSGVRAASKWVQRAVGAKQDGRLGPLSIAEVAKHKPTAVFLRVSAYRLRLYGRIVSRDPTQAKWAAGWNNRGTKFLLILARSLD